MMQKQQKKNKDQYDFSVHNLRRVDLVNAVKQQQAMQSQDLIILFAGFERGATAFRQESSFYYYTGLVEPGSVLVINSDGKADLYVPNCMQEREKWMAYEYQMIQKNAVRFGVATIDTLGDQCYGYQFHPFFAQNEYRNIIGLLEKTIAVGGSIFTLMPDAPTGYVDQRLLLDRLKHFIPSVSERLKDISPIVADLRRRKDQSEIELIYKAVEVTALAQEAAAQTLGDGVTEAEVQASLEYMFTGSGARPAFASIVGGGKNSTVLHYHDNNGVLKNGDLVVVDIGAELHYYAADITRTYPVSGAFTKRQKEIYMLVLETQEYIASCARPGMWLSNKDKPDESLNHLAKKYLKDHGGYDRYFPHGIGHFLGLDVHDVGDYMEPLREGDVITIEPGIYIPEEKIGIRIEDNYWIVKDGVVCLSEFIPKQIEDIEALVQDTFAESDDEEDIDDSSEYDG
ncbi:MAG TPA: aminopeptidase P N-terminal domain-containing protein [Candidatus Babeliales bacterium]|nr:aminopeptidase P N-terminal domain-containing protein [Candidatus Babeliales bacterium]